MTKKTSSKKQRQRARHNKNNKASKKQEIPVADLIQAADIAVLQGDDPFQAIALYDAAVKKLMLLQSPPAKNANGGAAEKLTTTSDDKQQSDDLLLVSVLEKRAEQKVSVGDRDGACQDFKHALEELNLRTMNPTSSEMIDTSSPPSLTSLVDPELLERRAGLHLYIGQLCEGKEALEQYKRGIELLGKSLEMRQISLKENQGSSTPPITKKAAAAAKSTDNDEKMQAIDHNNHDDEDWSDEEDANESDKMQADSDDDDEDEPLTPEQQLAETRKQLAAACCTAAELFLTDLCFEPNAEQECEALIDQALKLADPTDGEPVVDALQTIASLRLSQQGRQLEAVGYMLRTFAKMQEGCKALAALVGVREEGEGNMEQQEAKELLELDAVQNLPGYEFRCQTAKLLLECVGILKEQDAESRGEGRMNECANAAIDILGSLLAENDEVVEVWQLAGDAFVSLHPPNHDLAAHYWERSIEMLTVVKQSLDEQIQEADTEEEDNELAQQMDEIECRLEDIKLKLAKIDPEAMAD